MLVISHLGVRVDPIAHVVKANQRHPATPVDLVAEVGPLRLANPVMPASGCFGPELAALISTSRLGAVVTKTLFLGVRSGNPAHRLAETAGGMLNAVGIPSPGTVAFCDEILPRYAALGPPVIISIGGLDLDDYAGVTDALANEPYAALEVNVSCPNLEAGGLAIGVDPTGVERVVAAVAARTNRPVIAKLTPNVTAIADLARAAQAAGACAVTVANTFVASRREHRTGRPLLGNGSGGLSGPAIKPLALQKVAEVAGAVDIPIIGCGGVCTSEDALEYLAVGASAIQVGTATFTRPRAMLDMLDELPAKLAECGCDSVSAFRRRAAREVAKAPLTTPAGVLR